MMEFFFPGGRNRVRIAVDSDEAGLELKATIIEHLRELGAEVEDLKFLAGHKSDYPDIGYHLAKCVANREFERGVLICGTGLGMAMIANKVDGVYAGACHDVYSAERLLQEQRRADPDVRSTGDRSRSGEVRCDSLVALGLRGGPLPSQSLADARTRERGSGAPRSSGGRGSEP
jgi:ribose 5-phosphate isomerase B